MIRNCQNCAGKIRYSIRKKTLVCDSCSSTFNVGDHELPEDIEKYECNEYTCNACGSKIIINESEVSTFCIYCGSSNVVFDRVVSENAPKGIIPFKITREQASQTIRDAIKNSTWVPKEFKNFKDSLITPVYVPYYLTNVEYDGSVIAKGEHNTKQLNGFGSFSILTDASRKLDDDTMAGLEPYDLEDLMPFDTDYLLGFHSNIPDLDPEVAVFRAKEKTQKKANKLYNNYCELNFPGSCVSNQYLRRDTIEIYNEPNFILLPVWFMTIMFNGDPYTFLVNGQTGLSVGNVPTDDRKVRLIRNLIAIPVTLIVFAIMFGFARLIMESRDFGQMVGMIFAQLFVSVFFLFFDFIIYSEIKKKYNSFDVDSRDRMLSVFANKRQKGD